jgi:hypothetical protein
MHNISVTFFKIHKILIFIYFFAAFFSVRLMFFRMEFCCRFFLGISLCRFYLFLGYSFVGIWWIYCWFFLELLVERSFRGVEAPLVLTKNVEPPLDPKIQYEIPLVCLYCLCFFFKWRRNNADFIKNKFNY